MRESIGSKCSIPHIIFVTPFHTMEYVVLIPKCMEMLLPIIHV